MKDKIYTDIICKGFCKYYKKGKEEIHCNSYIFIRNNFTPHELKILLDNSAAERPAALPHYSTKDEKLLELVCKKCDFFVDGCDYTDNRSGPPCGGYLIIKRLL